MELPELKRLSETILEETRNIATLVSSPTLDETCRDIVNLSLRQKLVQKIDEVKTNLERQVEVQENEIRTLPNFHKGKAVRICMYLADSQISSYVCLVTKASASAGDAAMKTKGTRYATKTKFADLVTKLKHDILDGRYDDRLTSKAANLIYETLK